MKAALVSAIATLALLAVCPAADGDGYIRVDEDKHAARLQTAVTRLEMGGATVDLIGAVHIADKAYYKGLNERFKGYDAVLFEMIGGEKMAAANVAQPAGPEPEGEQKQANLTGLHKMYDMVAKFLQLAGQAESIDYTAPNFVHADLTLEEFSRMQQERGESLVGFALKAAKAAPEPTREPDAARLLVAMVAGKSNLVKLEIVHTLGQGDDQVAALAGESVILSDRNRRCLEVMDRELAAGRRKLAIFYGAAHFPDMEKRLLEAGFKRVDQEWLTAWDIPKWVAMPSPAK
jgi:hypothetical protein